MELVSRMCTGTRIRRKALACGDEGSGRPAANYLREAE